jgi:Fur family zinc uptake transcriptional regulator
MRDQEKDTPHSHEGHDHVWATDLTRNQELVLGALAHADAPLSAYDILDRLRSDGLRGPPQVYRALEKLTERGLAHRLESLNAFVCCADAHCHQTGSLAFAICEGCGRVEEFSEPEVESRLQAWSDKTGFVPSRMTIELRGRCKGCSVSPPSSPPAATAGR